MLIGCATEETEEGRKEEGGRGVSSCPTDSFSPRFGLLFCLWYDGLTVHTTTLYRCRVGYWHPRGRFRSHVMIIRKVHLPFTVCD